MRRADAVGRSMRTSVGPRASTSRWPPKLSLSNSSRGEPSALHRKCASTLNTVASRTHVPSSRQEAQFRGVCACELTRSAGRMRVRGLVVRKRRLKEDVIDCTSAIFSVRGWSPIVCIAFSERRTVMSSNGVRRTSRFLSTASPRRIGTRRRSARSARSPSFACTQTQLSHRSCGTHLAARGRTASRANLAPRPRHDDVSRISICSGTQQRIWLATQPMRTKSADLSVQGILARHEYDRKQEQRDCNDDCDDSQSPFLFARRLSGEHDGFPLRLSSRGPLRGSLVPRSERKHEDGLGAMVCLS